MSGGRHTPPLFEILSRGGSASESQPPRRAASSRAERAPDPGRSNPVARLSVPVYAVYLAASIALGLCVAVWAVAYRAGRDAGEQETLQQLGTLTAPPPRSPDPLLAAPEPGLNGPSDPASQGPPNRPADTSDTTPPRTDPVSSRPTPLSIDPGFTPGPALNHRGEVVTDPRTPGTNYLHLASDLPRAEAERLLAYLAAFGVEAIAVPSDRPNAPGVDSLLANANNDLPLSVYSLRGVASADFDDAAGPRQRHQTLVARLGEVWLRDHRGSVNLAKTNWELYPPGR